MLGDNFKNAVMELNASNERGIDVVRNKIKLFAQQKISLPKNHHKIIILDEADSMTEGAQQALRRIMEIYSDTTRFALACNASEKIIEPIQSRCAVIRYSKIPDETIVRKLIEICKIENLPYHKDGIDGLVFTAQGDLRQAINNLQSIADGYGEVTYKNVFTICDEPHPMYLKPMIQFCIDGNFDKAFCQIEALYQLGYSSEDIITNIFRVCKMYSMPENLKLDYLKHIGQMQMRIFQGVNSIMQLSALIARLCKVSLDFNKKQ